MARQIDLIESETAARLSATGPRVALGVAVNADSLNSWFHAVLAEVAGWPDATRAAARRRPGVLRGQRIDWSAIPMLRFNDKDLHQTELLRRIASTPGAPGAIVGGLRC